MRARTTIRATDGPGVAVALPRLGDSDAEMEEQEDGNWEQEETAEDCNGDDLATGESVQGPRISRGPALFQSRVGKNKAFNWIQIPPLLLVRPVLPEWRAQESGLMLLDKALSSFSHSQTPTLFSYDQISLYKIFSCRNSLKGL